VKLVAAAVVLAALGSSAIDVDTAAIVAAKEWTRIRASMSFVNIRTNSEARLTETGTSNVHGGLLEERVLGGAVVEASFELELSLLSKSELAEFELLPMPDSRRTTRVVGSSTTTTTTMTMRTRSRSRRSSPNVAPT